MKADLRAKFIQPSIRIVSTWDPRKVRLALRDLQAGSFLQAASLWDAILEDDRVQATLGTRIKGILGLPLNFDVEAENVREAIDNDFWDMVPEETLDELLTDALGLGVSPAQVNYERKRGRWLPVLEVWHPSLVRYSEYEGQYYISTDKGEIKLMPDEGKWMMLTPNGRRRYWRKALVRSLAIPWLAKRYAISDWQRFSEVLGGGIKKGTIPQGAKNDDGQIDRFEDDLYNLSSSGVVIVPEGFDVELVVAAAHQPEAFEKLIAWADRAIAIAILGQNMTTEPGKDQNGVTGAREVRQDVLEADAEVLSTAIHKGIIRQWTELNFGDPEVLAPWPRWDTTPPPEDGKIYEYHLKAPLLKKNELRAKLGLPALDEGGDEFYVIAETQPTQPTPVRPPVEMDDIEDDLQDDPEDDPEVDPPELPPRQASYRMASGATQNIQGVIDGQMYADGLMKKASDRATQILEGNRRQVLELIADSKNADELRAGLVRIFEGLDSDELTLLNERVFMLAHLAGMHAVNVDV
jgi:phage gp29-like protein